MSIRFLTLGIILLGATAARAQDNQITNEDLMAEIRAIKADLSNRVSANTSSIAEVKQDIDQLANQFNQQVERQRQILDAISTEDSSGRRIPRLSAIMRQSDEFRQDVSGAVHNSLAKEGTLELANKTKEYRKIFVNQQEVGIEPGKTVTLKVPVGTITTRLPGQGIENWTVSAPDYQEKIDIVPQTTPVVTAYSAPTTTQTVFYTAPTETVTAYYPTTTALYPTTTAYYPTTTAYYPTTTAYYPTTSYYYPGSSWYYPTTSYYPTLFDWLLP